MINPNLPQPIPTKMVNRILITAVILLAFYAGYYHALNKSWERSYNRLQRRYENLQEQAVEATASAKLNNQVIHN